MWKFFIVQICCGLMDCLCNKISNSSGCLLLTTWMILKRILCRFIFYSFWLQYGFEIVRQLHAMTWMHTSLSKSTGSHSTLELMTYCCIINTEDSNKAMLRFNSEIPEAGNIWDQTYLYSIFIDKQESDVST